MTNHQTKRFASSCGILLGTVLLGPQTSEAYLMLPPDTLDLTGIVRDFSSTHSDFGITNVADMGHYVGMVAATLDANGSMVPTGSGLQVVTEWYDQNGNPIVPYAGPGLPGGHFDVDVYDTPGTTEVEHEHQYDDTHNVAYYDIVNDELKFNAASRYDNIIGPAYPNQILMVFENVHNGGGGSYRFDAGAGLVTGLIADGFTTTFDPASLLELRVDFVSLDNLRSTNPGTSQGDAVDRDDSFRVLMYDTVTTVMVYELVVYHHYKDSNGNGISDDMENLVPLVTNDACGNPIIDTSGAYGVAGTAGITDTASFDQWFSDVLGTNQSAQYTISLQRDGTGVYDYMTNSFFPIDGVLMGNEGEANNNLFTYKLSASFTYIACSGQFFEFESNDDAWAFVDSKLVIDLGGTVTPERQHVDLDRLNLVDGQTYTIDFFFAHRRVDIVSLFHMRTNLQLATGILPAVTAFYD